MKTIGLCLGSTRISMATIEISGSGSINVFKTDSVNHNGNMTATLQTILNSIQEDPCRIAVTGRKQRSRLGYHSISEGEAVESAYHYLRDKYSGYDTIVSAGGETFIAYKLDGHGKIRDVFTGNKCASGTGEFFLQQLKRMGLTVENAMAIVDLDNPYKTAGRCSVFCKSDCTHALNKGEPKSRVIAGLCKMMAGKILELAQKCDAGKLLLIGGTAQNKAMVEYVRRGLQNNCTLTVADESDYFEALGAAVWEGTAADPAGLSDKGANRVSGKKSFTFLPPLKHYANQVSFNEWIVKKPQEGDRCVVGLDVGSTTTKAVVVREKDDAVLASVYLRTNGDPIMAARSCYHSLVAQLDCPVQVIGLGVTGSGRQIAGLHAGTEGIVNEILAHATAAAHFDPEVDTIFEIGGQDAKYTFLVNGVPADYAMNEACSAGTGSFLEEAAKEAMSVDHSAIAQLALEGRQAPNFNDQCAAFIGSDIKTAIQEGIPPEDILAGLVYSVCQNYNNRVKGNRQVGDKVFMQGGVCYNRAVPLAMAAVTGKQIIVPPEPGLMGAYGVALDIKRKMERGLLKEKQLSLPELAERGVVYGKPFLCAGGSERCDRKCEIKMVEIDGSRYPFGGACNRYANLCRNVSFDVEQMDFVAKREQLVFEKNVPAPANTKGRRKIGLTKALLANSLFPFYYNFFSQLGLDVVVAGEPDPTGMERTGAAFCHPVELAHGMIASLLKQEVDSIFLPQIIGLPVENGIPVSVTCPLAQGEPYYLKAAFRELADKMISPILDFSAGIDQLASDFVEIGSLLGYSRTESRGAYWAAVEAQQTCNKEMKKLGGQFIDSIADHQGKGIVLFGRPYNAFSKLANMGVAQKFASRGLLVAPWDFLPYEREEPFPFMYWAMGQMMLKAAKLVKSHPQLFAAYITNFSCGPDSFIITFFRDIMGKKPSLVLELDAHTADAGLDTRIEAFLDVVDSYTATENRNSPPHEPNAFRPATVQEERGRLFVTDSSGVKRPLEDKKVQIIVPSMGRYGSQLFSAALKYAGYNSSCMEPAGTTALNIGRAECSCKECLPYILVTGGMIEDIEKRRQTDQADDVLVYFLADSSGPCRLGQYHVGLRQQLHRRQVKNVAILTLSSDNGYDGLNSNFHTRAWEAVVLADVLADIYSALLVLARDKNFAMEVFNRCFRRIERSLAVDSWPDVQAVLVDSARELAAIPQEGTLDAVPKVALLGEIFVRCDEFSRQHLVQRLSDKGVVTKVAPIAEFIYLCDYLLQRNLYHVKYGIGDRVVSATKSLAKRYLEKRIKQIMAQSGLYKPELIDIRKLAANARGLIPPQFTGGETVLTVGSTLGGLPPDTHGVICIGPFGCMPNRVAEAILTHNPAANELPFLTLETDGTPYSPLTEAKIELFCLRVARQKGISR